MVLFCISQKEVILSPFGVPFVILWIVLSHNLSKLGEHLSDDIFELIQSVWGDCRNIIHNNNAICSKNFHWFFS